MKKFNVYQNGSKINVETIEQVKKLGPETLYEELDKLNVGESHFVSLKNYCTWEYERVL